MLIIPAIDIQNGDVVRLFQGRLNKRIYSRDPVKIARHWKTQGAKLIHLIDLDGASYGILRNLEAVKEIIRAAQIPVEVGGGIRRVPDIKTLLKEGAWRVILGTKAAEDKSFLKRALDEFGEKIIVSIDAQKNKVLIKGWRAQSKVRNVLTFASIIRELGFKELIYTDILKDGSLKGPDIPGIKRLLEKSGLSVIASGGISSLNDIRRLKVLEKQGLKGIIIGKALYEGKFTLSEALKLT